MPSVCSACAPHVSGVGSARSAHGWRPSGVYIRASSSAHSFVHAHKSRRTQRTTTNAQRWSSSLDARVVVQCLRGVLCAWRVREVSLQIIHKGPLGKHNNQGGRLVPWQ